jgi:hypothetical protein
MYLGLHMLYDGDGDDDGDGDGDGDGGGDGDSPVPEALRQVGYVNVNVKASTDIEPPIGQCQARLSQAGSQACSQR